MTYQPKIPECPYKARQNQCVHKNGEGNNHTKKRYCGFKNEKDCELYKEWKKIAHNGLKQATEPCVDEDETK